VDDDDLLIGAYQGMLNTLDDYSTYWPPDRAKEATDDLEGEFGDVLLQLSKLADLTGVDLEQAVLNKIETLKKRHNI